MTRAASPRAIDGPRVLGFAEDHLPHTILHPAQFREIWSGEGHSPERELAAAVLECAASDLRSFRYARRRRSQRLFWQAYQWVASDAREWPFAFVNICEFLCLSPEALRESLLDAPLCERPEREAA